MKNLLIFTFCLIVAGTDAVPTVTGYRGRSVQIKCNYTSGYENYNKYLCRGKCANWDLKDVSVQSGSPAKDSRFSLYDETTAKVFTINITDLRPEDEGPYWCGIDRAGKDIYTKILLLVKMDDPVLSSVSLTTDTTHFTLTHIVSSLHGEGTHPTTANPLNEVNDHNIAPSSHDILGIPGYIMIPAGAVLFTVAVIIAITCKIKCQGSATVTQSPREMSGFDEKSVTEYVYQNVDPDPNQPDLIYQNVTSTNTLN